MTNGLLRLPEWVEDGWMTRSGKPVGNRDLWEECRGVLTPRRREIMAVYGVGPCELRDWCDDASREAMDAGVSIGG